MNEYRALSAPEQAALQDEVRELGVRLADRRVIEITGQYVGSVRHNDGRMGIAVSPRPVSIGNFRFEVDESIIAFTTIGSVDAMIRELNKLKELMK